MKTLSVVIVSLFLAATAVGQETTEKKGEMMQKEGMKQGQMSEKKGLMEFACKPECGFSVRSHDAKEVMAMGKMHAKQQHNMDLTDEQAKGMMKMKRDKMKKDEMKMEQQMH